MAGQQVNRGPQPRWAAVVPRLAMLVPVVLLISMNDRLARALAEVRTPMADDVLEPFGCLGEWSAPLLAASVLAGLALLFQLPRLMLWAARLIGGGGAGFAVAWLLGLAVTSLAPLFGAESWLAAQPGLFPSLHAAVAFAFAGAIAVGTGRLLTVTALTFAGLAVLQGVATGAEAPGAAAAGAWVGWMASAWLARRLFASWSRLEAQYRAQYRTQQGGGNSAEDALTPRREPSLGRVSLGLALLLGPLLFLQLGGLGFGDPDEGRYASIPYEMVIRGDYVTPTLNHLVYFEKPPLLYWCVAGAFQVFGFSEWAARLVPVLACALSVWVALLLGRAMFGARAGRLAAAVLATCPIWLAMGRFLVTDMLFSMLVFSSLAVWWSSHARETGSRLFRDMGFWVLLALAVLCKGPLAVVLVFGTIGTYALLCGRWKDVFRLRFLAMSLVGVAVAAPWFIAVALENPGYNHEFWYKQHLARFLGSDESGMHEAGLLFYLPYLPALFIPWVLFLPGALAGQWSNMWPADTQGKRAGVFLASGCVFVTVFLSASSGKLQVYLLPLLPLIAVGFGGLLSGVLERAAESADERAKAIRSMAVSARIGAVVLALGALVALFVGGPALREIEARGPGLVIALAAVLTVWAVALMFAARRGDVRGMLAIHAGGAAATVFTMILAAVTLMPNHSMQSLVRYIQPGLDRGAELVTFRGWLQSLSFYADRRIRIFHQSGEFHFGLDQLPPDERAKWYAEELADVEAILDSSLPVYCFFKNQEKAAKSMQNLDVEVYEIIWNQRRSIVGNAAAAAITPPREGGLLGERWEQFR